MDYAFQAMKKLRSAGALSADMGLENFGKAVRQVWSDVSIAVTEELEEEPVLQGIYQGILNQSKLATADFLWLGKPEAYHSFGQGRKKPSPLKYLLFLPAAAVLALELVMQWRAKNIPFVVLYGAVLAALALAAVLFAVDSLRAGPEIKIHVEQQVDPALAWSSLEKLAMAVDNHAAALYARVAQREEGETDRIDGLALAQALLDWDCQEGQAPDEIRTTLRIYLRSHGIETVEYTPERSAIFQLMPANGTRTVEPALIRKVKTQKGGLLVEEDVLLRRGLACIKQET